MGESPDARDIVEGTLQASLLGATSSRQNRQRSHSRLVAESCSSHRFSERFFYFLFCLPPHRRFFLSSSKSSIVFGIKFCCRRRSSSNFQRSDSRSFCSNFHACCFVNRSRQIRRIPMLCRISHLLHRFCCHSQGSRRLLSPWRPQVVRFLLFEGDESLEGE